MRICSFTPKRHTGRPSSGLSIEENCTSAASTTVIPPDTLDLHRVVGADEGRRVLVETDADRERVVGERGQQPAQTVTLPEMLVDDEPIGEPEARREAHGAGDGVLPHRRRRSCARTGTRRRRWCRPTGTPAAFNCRTALATGVPPIKVESRS